MAQLNIEVNTSGVSQIDTLNTKVSKLDTDTNKLTNTNKSATSSMLKYAAAIGGTVLAYNKLTSVAQEAVSLYRVQEQAEMKLAATLRATGNAAGFSSDELKAYASELQTLTTYGDEATLSMMSVLNTFKEISGDVYKRATLAIMDVSTVMGQDLQGAAIQVGKALNSPIAGLGALAEVGIQFSEVQKQMVADFMELGDVTSAQGLILQELESQFGGASAAMAQTSEGAMQQISNAYGDLNEQVGAILVKTVASSEAFTYLMEVMNVVGAELEKVLGNIEEDGERSFNSIQRGVESSITSLGYLYDILESIGDVFSVVWYSGETAFYAIQVVSSQATLSIYEAWQNLTNGIAKFFEIAMNGVSSTVESTINFIIEGINYAITGLNSIGLDIPLMGQVQLGRVSLSGVDMSNDISALLESRINPIIEGFETARQNLFDAYDDLFTSGEGASFAEDIIQKIREAYENADPRIVDDGISPPHTAPELAPFKTIKDLLIEEDTERQVKELVSVKADELGIRADEIELIKDLNDEYTIAGNQFGDLDQSIKNVYDSTKEATKEIDSFVFAFTDTLMGALQSSTDSLKSVFETSISSTQDYETAFYKVVDLQEQLMANPLDVTIGEEYSKAFASYLSGVDSYLSDSSKFGSDFDMRFESARVGEDTRNLQDTALKAYDVNEAMLDMLKEINLALEDGVLTAEESAKLQSMADDINSKNTELLKTDTILGTNTTLTTLAKDGTVNSLYKGQKIDAQVNTISGYATNAALTGTNSVSTFIKNLQGNASQGITIGNILGTVPDLGVDTGLGSAISRIGTNTGNTRVGTDRVYGALGGKSSNGTTLQNLKIKDVSTTIDNMYSYYVPTSPTSGSWQTGKSPPSNAKDVSLVGNNGSTTSYTYYAKGGFTGSGMGEKDHTGYKQAGIVHEGEYVAPKWMVDSNPMLFSQLENVRNKGSFAQGGHTTNNNISSVGDNARMQNIEKQITDLTSMFRQVSSGGNSLIMEII